MDLCQISLAAKCRCRFSVLRIFSPRQSGTNLIIMTDKHAAYVPLAFLVFVTLPSVGPNRFVDKSHREENASHHWVAGSSLP